MLILAERDFYRFNVDSTQSLLPILTIASNFASAHAARAQGSSMASVPRKPRPVKLVLKFPCKLTLLRTSLRDHQGQEAAQLGAQGAPRGGAREDGGRLQAEAGRRGRPGEQEAQKVKASYHTFVARKYYALQACTRSAFLRRSFVVVRFRTEALPRYLSLRRLPDGRPFFPHDALTTTASAAGLARSRLARRTVCAVSSARFSSMRLRSTSTP